MAKYKVYDWAGNDLTNTFGTFNDFEDAWMGVREEVENYLKSIDSLDTIDEELGEYQVLEA